MYMDIYMYTYTCMYYQSLSGSSPLMLAAQHGHTEMVQLLLQEGADVKLLNKVCSICVCHAQVCVCVCVCG